MKSPSARGRARVGAVVVAALIVAAGLLLAVGAGARSGKSVRDASYPPVGDFPYDVDLKVGPAPAKLSSHVVAKFHVVYASNGQKPPHSVTKSLYYKCRLDKRHKSKCSSPKGYTGLSKGRHRLAVQAFYKHTATAASSKKKEKFKVS